MSNQMGGYLGLDFTASERSAQRQMQGLWNGVGNPPSAEAAIEWATSRGVALSKAKAQIKGSNRKSLGNAARALVNTEGGEARRRRAQGSTRQTEARGAAAAAGTVASVDENQDGSVADDLLAGLEPPGVSSRGAALWPYQASDETLAGLTVENRSNLPANANPFSRTPQGKRIGPRYYEADTLSPLRWSPEQRADVQRLMQSIGLYGDKKIRLGSWTADDQAIFAEVLAASNVAGVRWVETLAGWRKNPPVDLLEQLRGDQPKRPTIQVSNPIDIRKGAMDVSRELVGAVDRGFVEGTVGPYQGAEAAAQRAVISDQDAGGGGTVTQAPSINAFAEDKLRREKPLEVDGYQFLGQFDNFLSMLGVQ